MEPKQAKVSLVLIFGMLLEWTGLNFIIRIIDFFMISVPYKQSYGQGQVKITNRF